MARPEAAPGCCWRVADWLAETCQAREQRAAQPASSAPLGTVREAGRKTLVTRKPDGREKWKARETFPNIPRSPEITCQRAIGYSDRKLRTINTCRREWRGIKERA